MAREGDGEIPAGTIEPRGSGAPVLCAPCNTKTGSWYGAELVNFVRAGMNVRAGVPRDDFDALTEHRWAQIGVETRPGGKGPYPLRVAKEIVTMMLATAPELGAAHPELCEFVLDRTRFGLAETFRLHLSLFAGPYARQTGLIHTISLDASTATFAEIAWPPFAYVLTVDTAEHFIPSCDITSFAQVGYDDHMRIELDLLIGFGHTGVPCDYRTKAMLERDRNLT